MRHLVSLALFSAVVFGTEAIPEPLLFDLIRPLDSKKGELEINTLFQKSYYDKTRLGSNDPFDTGATTRSHQQLEWSPEIEYALSDGFALEFELPAEGNHIEAYKFGGQYTFGKINTNYIHGVQILIESNREWKHFNSTVLYLGGYRFDEIFSTLFMIGGRTDLEGSQRSQNLEYLANGSIFAQLSHVLTIGLETNYAINQKGHHALSVVPQVHYEANRNIGIQTGIRFGRATQAKDNAFLLRVIYAF